MATAVVTIGVAAAGALGLSSPAHAETQSAEGQGQSVSETRIGSAAYGDWRGDAPGVRRHIRPEDLVPPRTGRISANRPRVVEPPTGSRPRVPPGFTVSLFADGMDHPRLTRQAPNGDLFVAETMAGQIRLLRARDGAAQAEQITVFATRLNGPFGLAFYPPGPDPRWLYVAENNAVVRIPYRSGDINARGEPDTVVAQLAATSGGHGTRDIVLSQDGKHMFVSVGSESNDAESLPRLGAAELKQWEAQQTLGAAWGDEAGRADVLMFTPEGKPEGIFATGIRNCVGLAVQPRTGDLWCSTNERDALGDDVPPDYVTRVTKGAFYGWPWYYIGDHEDPRHKGERPDLASRITIPDVLLQPHSASLQMTFYSATAGAAAFPPEYQGDAFSALHGSWNRATPTGYKVVRIRLRDGVPTGEYEDFLTGFVLDDNRVWGRPVGVTVAHDGALIVTDDGNGTIWRVAHAGGRR